MMDWNKFEQCQKEHYKDLLREAAQERLARLALAGRNPERPLFCRMLLRLGQYLIAWGQWLQRRFTAERSLESFPVVGRGR
jgi:hypothetical protein